MIHPIRAAVYLAVIVATSGWTTAGPRVYSNPEFGVRLPVPGQGLLCPTLKDEHDHGFGILLGGGGTGPATKMRITGLSGFSLSLMRWTKPSTCLVF